MSNDPRPAKPPLPLLKRPRSGTVPVTREDSRETAPRARKSSETARSGTIAAVRPPALTAAPRPTNVLRGLEKTSAAPLKAGALERRPGPVLRRLDPTFSGEQSSESWEPRGTLAGAPYRDTMPTVPSPEVLESLLLAERSEGDAKSAALAESKPAKPGARAQFEPAHPPAVSVSPIIELEKAVAVIVDPLAIVSAPAAQDAPASEDTIAAGVPVLEVVATHEAVGGVEAGDAFDALEGPASDEGAVEPDPTERSRITLPPARRRRRGRSLRALLSGVLLLGGALGAGWYRYPAQCEQGWSLARAELTLWQGALQYQWSLGMRALDRWRSD